MDTEILFRVIMITGFAIVVPWAGYYRVRSQSTKEKLDRRQEGLPILILSRLCALAGITGVMLFLINPEWMSWASIPLPMLLRWKGVLIGILAGVLWIWTFRHLDRNLTDTVVTRKQHTLVTSGPYRFVRHPFYVSFALLVIANSLVTANWFIFLASGSAFFLIVLRTKKEEANLESRFGDEYRRYAERVGRFFPKF